MRISQLYVLLGLYLLCTNVCAANTETSVSTTGDCSPAIGINNGTVIINCENKIQNQQFLKLVSKYNDNFSALSVLSKKTKTLESSLINLESESLASLHKTQSVSTLLLEAREEFTRYSNRQRSVLNRLEGGFSEVQNLLSEYNSTIQIMKGYNQNLFDDIERRLSKQRIQLSKITRRLSELEYKVSNYLNNELESNEGFVGISIGGISFDSEMGKSFGVEYELWQKRESALGIRGSVYFELAYVEWSDIESYETLPGIAPIEIENEHKLKLLGIGSRLFLKRWSDNLHSYIGLQLGSSIASTDNTFSYGITFGTELYSLSTRLAFEVGIKGFSRIEKERVVFNPFGDAEIETVTDDQRAVFASLKIAI